MVLTCSCYARAMPRLACRAVLYTSCRSLAGSSGAVPPCVCPAPPTRNPTPSCLAIASPIVLLLRKLVTQINWLNCCYPLSISVAHTSRMKRGEGLLRRCHLWGGCAWVVWLQLLEHCAVEPRQYTHVCVARLLVDHRVWPNSIWSRPNGVKCRLVDSNAVRCCSMFFACRLKCFFWSSTLVDFRG